MVNVSEPASVMHCGRRLVARPRRRDPSAESAADSPPSRELHVEQLARRDIDVDAAVVGELPRYRDHGGKSADVVGVTSACRAAGRPQVDARRSSPAPMPTTRTFSGEATHRADRDVAPVQSRRGDRSRTRLALEPERRPLLRRQQRARVHPVQADLPGARGQQHSRRRRRRPRHHRRAPGREQGRHEEGRETHRATVTQRRCRRVAHRAGLSHTVQGCRTCWAGCADPPGCATRG